MNHSFSESDLKYLNRLRKEKPEAFNRKLRILGIKDSDVPYVSIQDEYHFQSRNKAIKEKHISDPYKYSWEWDEYDYDEYDYDEYEYYDNEREEVNQHHLYLIDGDNHINEALERIDLADEMDDIRIFVSQDGLYIKLIKRKLPQVQVIKVTPGNQAVDNQIKSVLGNAVKSEFYDDIFVISRDKGYETILQKYRSRYRKKKSHLDRREKF